MTKPSSIRRWNSAALGAIFVIAMTVGCGNMTARAADDEDVAPDTKMFQNFLRSFGLRKEGDGIEYRERSPLVLPPSNNLPAPETTAPTPSSWPKDPDVQRAKQIKASRAKSNPNPEDARPLLPSDYSVRGAPSPASKPTAGSQSPQNAELGRPMSPKDLGTQGIFTKMLPGSKEEYETFTNEPARASLTDPPPGYRTPSASQPYGVGKQKWTPTVTDKNEPVK
jgi:hypothetical protein